MNKDEIVELGEKLQLIFTTSENEFYYILGYVDAQKKED